MNKTNPAVARSTAAPLGKHTTSIEALRGQRLDGLTAIVTGASSGIGVETARALAFAGADVVMACRSVVSGEQVAATLRAELPGGAGRLEVAALKPPTSPPCARSSRASSPRGAGSTCSSTTQA